MYGCDVHTPAIYKDPFKHVAAAFYHIYLHLQ